MTASNYRQSLALVLAHEGGYVNHPSDPGGPTNQGVTQKVYDAYRAYHKLKAQSVKLITSLEVSEIYDKNYWRLVKGDSLPCGLDYAVFDFGVNSGVSRAVRYLQLLAGVEDDGVIGVQTLAAVEKKAAENEEQLILQYCANRVAFLKSLSTFPTFGKGWMRRVVGYTDGVQLDDSGVIDYAIKMARADDIYVMPIEIGTRTDEQAGKAVAPLEPQTFPLAPEISTRGQLAALAAENDELAKQVGQ